MGKLNYCIKSLKDKGFIKIQNFKNPKNKLLIFVNPKGISEKDKVNFKLYERKMAEYDEAEKRTREKMINNKVILITGGTGSFGNELVKYLLKFYKQKKS